MVIIYIDHALINALSARMIRINLNAIFCTRDKNVQGNVSVCFVFGVCLTAR